MKFLLLFSAFIVVAVVAGAQEVYTIKADSVKLTGCDSSELIIENHTQHVKGFLLNTGNGRTKFQRGAIKIDDFTYLIGTDTLHLAGGSVDSNVFYVNKKYTGTARAVITGNTLASVSSGNASYTSQLSKAVPGSMMSCYPDPFSARNAALDAIAAGRITSAQIVVLEGNKYTVGSNDSTKNGSIDGLNANNKTIADIQFSGATLTSDTSISSIMKNKVDMYFSTGTNLTYINSSYSIWCIFNNENTDLKSGIYGMGTFYQVYGQANGFGASFCRIDSRNAYADFHAREVILQQFVGFSLLAFSNCNIEVDNLFSADANIFAIGTSGYYSAPIFGNAANSPEMLHVKIKNWKYGKSEIPYPSSNDYWYGIGLGSNAWREGTIATFDIGNLYMSSTDGNSLFYVGTSASLYNTKLTVNIDNLVQKDSHIHYYPAGKGGLLGLFGTGQAVNNSITYNIKSARIEAALLGFINFSSDAGAKNNRLNINVGELQKDSSAFPGGLFNLTNDFSRLGEQMLISVKGDFKSYDNKPMIYQTNPTATIPLANKYVFSGTYYMAHSGQSVAHFYTNAGKVVAFKDAVLINDGVTPSLVADSLNTPIYIKNVHANSAPTANAKFVGDAGVVLSDVSDFFKW